MRAGVIGCGDRGGRHLRSLWGLPEVTDLVAIDPRPEVLDRLATAHPGVAGLASLDHAMDAVDVAVIAAPIGERADLTVQAAEAGKHVLVEQPMAPSTAEARRMVDAADRAGVILAVAHTALFDGSVRKLAEIVDGGELGRLTRIDGASLGLGPYRRALNVVWDRAVDEIAISTLLLGTAPDTVAAWGDRHTTGFAEDAAQLRLSYHEQAVTSTIRASWLDPDEVRRTVAVGSERMAVRDALDQTSRVRLLDRGRRVRFRLGEDEPGAVHYRDGEIRVPYVPDRDPWKVQTRLFLHSCRTGTRPAVDGRFGLIVTAVLEAADRSLAGGGTGVPVELSPTSGAGGGRSRAVA